MTRLSLGPPHLALQFPHLALKKRTSRLVAALPQKYLQRLALTAPHLQITWSRRHLENLNSKDLDHRYHLITLLKHWGFPGQIDSRTLQYHWLLPGLNQHRSSCLQRLGPYACWPIAQQIHRPFSCCLLQWHPLKGRYCRFLRTLPWHQGLYRCSPFRHGCCSQQQYLQHGSRDWR